MRYGGREENWPLLWPQHQVVLLQPEERLGTMAASWCTPADPQKYVEIIDGWGYGEVLAVSAALQLPVYERAAGAVDAMRRNIKRAVEDYASDHPELLDAAPEGQGPSQAGADDMDLDLDGADAAEDGLSRSPVAQRLPAGQRAAASPPRARSGQHRAALTALHSLPLLGRGAAPSPDRKQPASRRAVEQLSRRPAAVSVDFVADEDDPDDDGGDADWDAGDAGRSGGELSGNGMVHALESAGHAQPFAMEFIASAKEAAAGRSLYELFKYDVTPRFGDKQTHAKSECIALARVIDAILLNDRDRALELLCRRLGGVQIGAETGNWEMCRALESAAERRSFVPERIMASALKTVTRMQAIQKGKYDGYYGGASGSGGGTAGSGRSSKKKANGRSGGGDRNSAAGGSFNNSSSGAVSSFGKDNKSGSHKK